jgi:polar amino acid transport system substrate-binding protein
MMLKSLAWPLLLTVVAGCAGAPPKPDAAVLKEIAPTGKLRFGIVYAPEASTFFVARGADGQGRGVTVDLARELGRALGVPVEFFMAPNSGEVTDALAEGRIDAAFMPADDERRRRLDVGPAYSVLENTYLVRGESGIRSIAEVDRPGVRVIAIAGTTTFRSAGNALKQIKVTPVPSVDESLAALREGRADAFALTHDTLGPLAARVPGSRILEGAFQRVFVSVLVKKNHPAALAYVKRWLEDAKAGGAVRRAFDAAGFTTAAVAPPVQ